MFKKSFYQDQEKEEGCFILNDIMEEQGQLLIYGA